VVGVSEVTQRLSEVSPDAILWDGFDAALVGIGERCGMAPVAVYDRAKCIDVLREDGLSWEDAEEYFCFNVEGCYAGELTPIIAVFDFPEK
tara:strand:- start:1865 stop:2137 length:273 start_codon:yes stop_codon:yes gene_type:complete